jgi:hypothetical protein
MIKVWEFSTNPGWLDGAVVERMDGDPTQLLI